MLCICTIDDDDDDDDDDDNDGDCGGDEESNSLMMRRCGTRETPYFCFVPRTRDTPFAVHYPKQLSGIRYKENSNSLMMR